MSQVFLMHTIVSRGMLPKILSFYQETKIAANLVTLGRGTAASEVLDYFGLEASEKAVLFSVVTDSVWQEVKKGLTRRFRIDAKFEYESCILRLDRLRYARLALHAQNAF